MTDSILQSAVSMAGLHDLGNRDLADAAAAVAQKLSVCARVLSVDVLDEWARVTVKLDGQVLQLGVRHAEIPDSNGGALGMRFGFNEAFGMPSGELIDQEPARFLYLPPDVAVDELLSIASGKVHPARHMELVNFSNRHAMSVPRPRFPSSALVMLGERHSRAAADRYFELWTQGGGTVQFHTLERTGDPYEAASEALELGYCPTVYRCLSGRFVCFRPTSGGIFFPA